MGGALNTLEAMRIYVRVAEVASFTQAAQSLGLPKSSLSSAVQWLEGQLGARLLQRTTRRVQMTHDGLAYYERCKDMLSDFDDLQAMFQSDAGSLQGRLRVDLPIGAARDLVLPRLPEFLAEHPGIEVELGCTDRFVDLIRDGFDCVLRVGSVADSSLVARSLGALRQINCASSGYLARHGVPCDPEQLDGHSLVHYALTLGAKAPGFQYVDPLSGEVRWRPMAGRLTVNNSVAYQAACLAGLGIIQIPESGLRGPLARGEVVEVLPDYRPPDLPLSLLYVHRRHRPRRLQAFMDWLEGIVVPQLAPRDA